MGNDNDNRESMVLAITIRAAVMAAMQEVSGVTPELWSEWRKVSDALEELNRMHKVMRGLE